MRRQGAIMGGLAASLLSIMMSGVAAAETLEMTCAAAGGSDGHRLTVDLGTGLVSNDAGGSGRRWAARVTGTEVTWDEVFDSRIGHSANHYSLDRNTGKLSGTEISSANHQVMIAGCRKD